MGIHPCGQTRSPRLEPTLDAIVGMRGHLLIPLEQIPGDRQSSYPPPTLTLPISAETQRPGWFLRALHLTRAEATARGIVPPDLTQTLPEVGCGRAEALRRQ